MVTTMVGHLSYASRPPTIGELLHEGGRPLFSFELFPPKTAAGEASLYENVGHLMAFQPDVITCTFGAGGSTRDKTLEITTQVRKRFGVRVASHLTCVGSTTDQLRGYLREARGAGIENIVALPLPRGEHNMNVRPPQGGRFRSIRPSAAGGRNRPGHRGSPAAVPTCAPRTWHGPAWPPPRRD